MPPPTSIDPAHKLLVEYALGEPRTTPDLLAILHPSWCPSCLSTRSFQDLLNSSLRAAMRRINASDDLGCLTIIVKRRLHWLVLTKADAVAMKAARELEMRQRIRWL